MLDVKSGHSSLVRVLRRAFLRPRRSTNQLLAGIVMSFTLSRHSTALQQRRWYTEPLDTVEHRSEQLRRYRYLGHVERRVLGVRAVLATRENWRLGAASTLQVIALKGDGVGPKSRARTGPSERKGVPSRGPREHA